jgi:hypothetical protein
MATCSPNTVDLDPPSRLLPPVRALPQLPEALHPLVERSRLSLEVRGSCQRQGASDLLEAPLPLPLKLWFNESSGDTLDSSRVIEEAQGLAVGALPLELTYICNQSHMSIDAMQGGRGSVKAEDRGEVVKG